MDIADPRVPPELVPRGSRAIVIAEHQDEYRDLPSVRTPGGQVITRWSPSTEERAAIVRGEDIYVTLITGGGPINPMFVTVGHVDWNTNEPKPHQKVVEIVGRVARLSCGHLFAIGVQMPMPSVGQPAICPLCSPEA